MPNVSGTATAPRPLGSGTFATTSATPVDLTLASGGLVRTYRVYTPATLPGGARPLLIVHHGKGGSGPGIESVTHFDRLADQNGFIVAYPDAVNHLWSTDGSGADDVGFVVAMVGAIGGVHTIDPLRVYAAGFSNGACMTAALGLERPDVVAAIGLVSGDYTQQTLAYYGAPTVPMPVIQFHGTADPIWAYTGFSTRDGTVYPDTEASWTQWAVWDNCSTSATIGAPIPDPSGNGTSATLKSYVGGASNTQSLLYTITGGGHQWPNGISIPSGGTMCNAVDASQLIWTFVSGYTRIAVIGTAYERAYVRSPAKASVAHSPAKATTLRGT